MEGYVHGEKGKGRPKKRWVDQVRQDCEEMGFGSIQDATCVAQERECWRIIIIIIMETVVYSSEDNLGTIVQ